MKLRKHLTVVMHRLVQRRPPSGIANCGARLFQQQLFNDICMAIDTRLVQTGVALRICDVSVLQMRKVVFIS